MPPLPLKDRYDPVTWSFKVIPPWPSGKIPEGLSVAVTLEDDRGDPRTFTAHPAGNGLYHVTVRPEPNGPDRKVALNIRVGKRPDDVVRVEVKDRDVTVGGRPFRLGDLAKIQRDPRNNRDPSVFLTAGGGLDGPIKGLGTVKAIWHKKTINIDLTRVERIDLGYADPAASIRTLDVTAELRNGARTLATAHRTLDFSVAPAITVRTVQGDYVVVRPARPFQQGHRLLDDDGLVRISGSLGAVGSPATPDEAPRPARNKRDSSDAQSTAAIDAHQAEIVQPIEGKISDVVAGGAGRYLLLVLKDVRKLAIFDVDVPGVIKSIPLPSENVLVAAGARKFVIAYPDEKLLERWDFETLASEGGLRPLPVMGELKALAMGSRSEGPILAKWVPAKVYGPHQHFSFVDLSSLEVLRVGSIYGTTSEVSQSRGSFNIGGNGWDIRASPGGRLFEFWGGTLVTASLREGTLCLIGGEKILQQWRELRGFGFATPGADEVSLFVGMIGRVDTFSREIEASGDPSLAMERDKNRPEKLISVPSASPNYYLVLREAPISTSRSYEPHGPVNATVHAAGDGVRLLAIPAMQEMTGFSVKDWFPEETPPDPELRFTVDERFHLVPAARRLVTIPPKNDRLVIRSVDVESAVARAEGIVVLSTPLLSALAGVPYRGRIEARSSKGDVRFELVEGPKGLTISRDGDVSWPQPDLPDGFKAKIVLSLSDPAGRRRTHGVVVRVQ
jgi:hypothetical protein